MSQMQPARGTHDLLSLSMKKHRYVIETAQKLAALYGFEEIKTPIFEFTHVFNRTLGDTSDIVQKEMYSFTDRGGEEICLRPEGTAGIMRAMISESLFRNLPQKLFYEGPMFRYERPQKGRFRQFHQIGVECIGVESPVTDAEVILLGYQILKALNIENSITLNINSIGDTESRANYRKVLVDYYQSHVTKLSEDSQKRLSINPLRILDSKNEGDIQINKNAPILSEHLNAKSKEIFESIQNLLTDSGLKFQVNPSLVRGLDYYSHVVFEYRTSALGSQDAVLAGGRYDGLAKMMGAPETAAVGWAAGIERLCLLLEDNIKSSRPIAIIPVGEVKDSEILKLAQELRYSNFSVDLSYSGNMSNRMKKAGRVNAIAAIIIGDEELKNSTVNFKLLDSGVQHILPRKNLSTELSKLLSE
jgi:histidyl-tRNA synthetase